VRQVFHNEEWWFVLTDITSALTGRRHTRTGPFRDQADVGQADAGTGFRGRTAQRLDAGDEVYGRDGKLRRWLEEPHQPYVLAVASDQRLWQQDMRQHRVDEIVNRFSQAGLEASSGQSGSQTLRLGLGALG
jgi:hypothetical protein